MSVPATPDAETLLRSIADAAPGLWFAQRYADAHGIPRDALSEPLWLLRQAGLVEVGDWVKGLGQGLRLSVHGEKAVAVPLAARPPADPRPARGDEPTELVRGDEARNAVLDPPPAIIAPSLLYANLAWFVVGCVVAWVGGVGTEFLKGDAQSGVLTTLTRTGAMTAAAVWSGEWWRLATCCFVHIGLFHLLCNMLMLGMMGPFAEALWGRQRFALIYAVAGVCGSATAVALHPLAPSGGPVITAGASGALWGMLGGMIVWVIRARRHLPPEFTRDRLQRLGFIVVLNAAVSFAPGVSAEAHFGGGIAGVIVAWAVATGHRRKRLWAVGGVALTLLLFALLLLGAMRWSDDWQVLKDREQATAVRAALGDDWKRISPAVVADLHARFALANPARIATDRPGPASLRALAEQVRETATAVLTRLPTGELADRYRDYLAAVVGYATTLRDELDRPGRKESPELDAAWQHFSDTHHRLGL